MLKSRLSDVASFQMTGEEKEQSQCMAKEFRANPVNNLYDVIGRKCGRRIGAN